MVQPRSLSVRTEARTLVVTHRSKDKGGCLFLKLPVFRTVLQEIVTTRHFNKCIKEPSFILHHPQDEVPVGPICFQRIRIP